MLKSSRQNARQVTVCGEVVHFFENVALFRQLRANRPYVRDEMEGISFRNTIYHSVQKLCFLPVF
jgi:hypothetical protein